MQENIVMIHNVFKKNYITKFSTSSILKKIDNDNFFNKYKNKKE